MFAIQSRLLNLETFLFRSGVKQRISNVGMKPRPSIQAAKFLRLLRIKEAMLISENDENVCIHKTPYCATGRPFGDMQTLSATWGDYRFAAIRLAG